MNLYVNIVPLQNRQDKSLSSPVMERTWLEFNVFMYMNCGATETNWPVQRTLMLHTWLRCEQWAVRACSLIDWGVSGNSLGVVDGWMCSIVLFGGLVY
jgi:hypothetical protein